MNVTSIIYYDKYSNKINNASSKNMNNYFRMENKVLNEDEFAKDVHSSSLSIWDLYEKMNGMAKKIPESDFQAQNLGDNEKTENQFKEESETKTDIVVKPDGSRVLVITINVGGTETTMSLEISKPTNELDAPGNRSESYKQEATDSDGLSETLNTEALDR